MLYIRYQLNEFLGESEFTVASAAAKSSHPAERRIFILTYSRTQIRIDATELHAILFASSVQI